MEAENNNIWLPYTEIVQFAFERIASIKDADEIRRAWGNRITDITKDRHAVFRDNLLDVSIPIHAFIGQENYFFAFKESPNFHGEFSVDFMPKNPRAIFEQSGVSLRLANWRVQGFAKSFFARRETRKKQIAVREWLFPTLGEPLSEGRETEWVNQLKKADRNIECWKHSIGDVQYGANPD